MELMSSLLFFALCTVVPQALGIHPGNLKVFHNHSKLRDRYYKQKQISLNMKAPSFMFQSRNKSTLGDVKQDHHCHECRSCMENAVKHHQNHHKYIVDPSLSDEDLRNEIRSNEKTFNYLDRSKRSIAGIELKPKLTKDKDKSRKPKYYSVSKYLQDGVVFALKLKEYAEQLDQANNSVLHKDASTCQIYQVKNSFSCK